MLTQTQKLLLSSTILLSNASAKCPFGYGAKEDDPKPEEKSLDGYLAQLDDVVVMSDEGSEVRRLQAQDIQYPSQLFTCKKDKVMKTGDSFTRQDYEDIAESVNQKYEEAEDEEAKIAFAGCLVRLAGHDLMDFRYDFHIRNGKETRHAVKHWGGVDGCVDFKDKDNKGLVECIQDSNIIEAYEEHCDVVSLADFIVIAGEATMARTSTSFEKLGKTDTYAEGTMAKRFRDQFKFGRATQTECENNEGLMPDPEKGCDDINSVFKKHIFKYHRGREQKKLFAAILGAHTLGSAKVENSGYEGFWSDQPGVFNNDYYRQMITRGWGPDRAVNGNEGRNQWKIVDSDPIQNGLMLNTDLCLAYDNNSLHQECMEKNNFNNRKCKKLQNKGKPINALETQCCAWTHKGALFNKGVFSKSEGKGQICGKEIPARGRNSRFTAVKDACCANQHKDSTGDCDSSAWPKGQAFSHVLAFAAKEETWLESFAQAWKIATENGHLDLKTLDEYEDKNVDEYQCGKMRTRRTCEQHKENCAWYKKTTPDSKGRFRNHCGLASKAPPKPQRSRRPRNNRNRGGRGGRGGRRNRMNRNHNKKRSQSNTPDPAQP